MALLGQATNVAPAYEPGFCIAVKKSVGACSACRDVCPHEAITIQQRVVIDEVDCTGCGLCIQACPSQALSASDRLRSDGAVRCSQVDGSAQAVNCLGRMEATDVLQLGRGQDRAVLARGDCSDCPIGDARVVEAVDEMVSAAAALAAFRPRPLDIEVRHVGELASGERPASISRRQLFSLGASGMRDQAAYTLASYDVGGKGDTTLPAELHQRFQWLRHARPEDDTKVPWILPRVSEACILCPVCTNVCPTQAFERELEPLDNGPAQLWFSPERCNGCDACVASCPVHAISLDDDVTFGELRRASSVAQRGSARRAVPT